MRGVRCRRDPTLPPAAATVTLPGMEPLPGRASVVVVGGGVVGTSVAHQLATAGVRDVVLVEAGTLGGGSSAKPVGGLRGHFGDALNIALALRGLEHYTALAEREPALCFERVGYLFLLRTAEEVARLEACVAEQNAQGLPSRLVDPGEATRLCPVLDPAPFAAATWSPTDGHAVPAVAIEAWAREAAAHGAHVAERCAVEAIDVRDGEITAVRTNRGTIATDTVVCAAGAWARAVGAMAGVDLDVRPVRRQLCLTEPRPGAHDRLPFTIDLATSSYLHNAGDALLLGWTDPDQPEGFGRDYDPSWLPLLRERIAEWAPSLAGLPVASGWAGLYEQTPDSNALIGEAPHVGRFLYATGFSGHGFSQAPAAAEIVRDLVLGRDPFVDVAPLRAERFAERRPVREATIV